MKQIIFSALFFVLISCNSESKTGADKNIDSVGSRSISTNQESTQQQTQPSPQVDTEKWRIDISVADKMKKFVRGCSGSNCKTGINIVDPNNEVYMALLDKYKSPTYRVIPVEARYKDYAEAENYCKVRRFPNGSAKCDVRNYKTLIYVVLKQSTKNIESLQWTVEAYYDIVTICPPPPGSCIEIILPKDSTIVDSTKMK